MLKPSKVRSRGLFCLFASLFSLLIAALPTNAAQADDSTTPPAVTPLADPDTTYVARLNRYLTIGTSIQSDACGGTCWVPYTLNGAGQSLTGDGQVRGDLLPAGPGSWARRDREPWAPSLVHVGRTWLLFYAAVPRSRDRLRCLGVASAANPRGPFTPRRNPLVCNLRSGRWAIDPDAIVDPSGHLLVTLRNDAVAPSPETGLQLLQLSKDGRQILRRHTVVTSASIDWESTGDLPDTAGHTMENPAMFRDASGRWWMFYSGNLWRTARYATGLVALDHGPWGDARALPDVARPWFGYDGPGGYPVEQAPAETLPGNPQGSGGMSVFRMPGGAWGASWHYLSGADYGRVSTSGYLHRGDSPGWQMNWTP